MGFKNSDKLETSDIWTAKQVAEYLKMCEKTVYVHARSGSIPCTIIGNTVFRFSRKKIESLV